MGDLGVDTTMNIIENLQERVKEEKIKEPSECRQAAHRYHQRADGRGRDRL